MKISRTISAYEFGMSEILRRGQVPSWRDIYALVDPREPSIVRYVGCAEDLGKRLYGHLASRDNAAVNRWVRMLRDVGVKPEMVALASVRLEFAAEFERLVIGRFSDTVLNHVGIGPKKLKVKPSLRE